MSPRSARPDRRRAPASTAARRSRSARWPARTASTDGTAVPRWGSPQGTAPMPAAPPSTPARPGWAPSRGGSSARPARHGSPTGPT
ncbi:hypothetical protein [Ornithinimicrobium kibberense]|uniref:hypothetical protein n=1 Tax=Ornithinimicrobium kibberense TaxID=282060 RepID=UPI003621E7E7